MPERKFTQDNGYRYGFNGKENDNEIKSEGNQQDYGLRIYDPRLSKFLSVDPLTKDFPWNSTYAYAEGDPLNYIDLDGGEKPAVKAQATPISRIPIIKPVYSESPPLALQQARQRAMSTSPFLTPEQQKANGIAEINKKNRNNHATLNQGGFLGSDQYKIMKGRYDLYGQFLPGISDIDDGLTFISSLKDGDYKAAAFTALFFLPGGDFLKPLKKLKGAGKLGGTSCMDYTKDFMNKYSKKIEDAGGTVTKKEIDIGSNGIIGTANLQIATTGKHQFVEVTSEGVTKIFDNAHPDGILKTDYEKILAGSNANKGIISGSDLLKDAKKIN